MDQALLFLAKVVALEALRRGSNAKCRPLWWGLQGISLLQTLPFKWLQKWQHVRRLTQCTQGLSKPMLFLSIATTFTSSYDEQRRVTHLTDVHTEESGREVESSSVKHKSSKELEALKQVLEEEGFALTERLDDDELERFLVAVNNDLERFPQVVKKTLIWRETYYFLSPRELDSWSSLVYWHDRDSELRPVLVIRLGQAYATLSANDRPRFAQAVVSQVEYGILHLLHKSDPRVTVIMDCDGTHAIGFPGGMMKSCSLLVQEHYPTRLATLFVINLPAVVRVIANAVIQVLKPVTRRKIHMEGDNYLSLLGERLGGVDRVPLLVGGSCCCTICSTASTCMEGQSRSIEPTQEEEEVGRCDQDDPRRFSSFNFVILGFILLVIMISFMSDYHDAATH